MKYRWIGGDVLDTSTNWDVPSNWEPPGVPTRNDDIVVPFGIKEIRGPQRSVWNLVYEGNPVNTLSLPA